MKSPKSIAVAFLSAGVCMMLSGCFSYSKEVSHTATPAVEEPAPPVTSSTTTTTTDNGLVQRQHTSSYTYP